MKSTEGRPSMPRMGRRSRRRPASTAEVLRQQFRLHLPLRCGTVLQRMPDWNAGFGKRPSNQDAAVAVHRLLFCAEQGNGKPFGQSRLDAGNSCPEEVRRGKGFEVEVATVQQDSGIRLVKRHFKDTTGDNLKIQLGRPFWGTCPWL